MTEYQKIMRLQFLLAQRTASTLTYNFPTHKLKEGLRELRDEFIKEVGYIDVTQLTKDELQLASFVAFGKITNNPLYLIPCHLYSFLKFGQKLIDFEGDKIEVKKDYDDITLQSEDLTISHNPDYIDNDCRHGMLAYGVFPKVNLIQDTKVLIH